MRLKFLLRPGWLALTLVVFAFAGSCFTLLSPWQFGRNAQRATQNSGVEASFTGTPKPLDELLAPGVAPDSHSEWRVASMSGTYLPEDEVIARLRTVQGEAAFEVMAPFRRTNGEIVLIDRGFLRPNDTSGVPSYAAPPAGVVQLVTRIRVNETDPKNRDAFADASTEGKLQAYVVDSRVVARATKLDIRPGYFQLDLNQPGVLGALPLPQTDSGPFLSYALQWIAFGTMAIGGWAYFTIRELKPGGALTTDAPSTKRKSVSEILAEDEAEEAAKSTASSEA